MLKGTDTSPVGVIKCEVISGEATVNEYQKTGGKVQILELGKIKYLLEKRSKQIGVLSDQTANALKQTGDMIEQAKKGIQRPYK